MGWVQVACWLGSRFRKRRRNNILVVAGFHLLSLESSTRHKESMMRISSSSSSSDTSSSSSSSLIVDVTKVGLKTVVSLVAFYFLVAWPPLHWFYEAASPAGPSSVYIPGGGFSGFWFHLGYLQSMNMDNHLHDYDYYCFSSGCLGKQTTTTTTKASTHA